MIYLDNAATTYPKPESVINSVAESLKFYGANPGRAGHDMAIKTGEKIYESRKAAADFFGASGEENVSFTLNCTTALNFCIKGNAYEKCNFIVSSLEHNAVMRPLEKMREDDFCFYRVAEIACDTEETVANFEKLIDEKTAAIVVTGASNVFGVITPVKELAALAKKYGIKIIVDAAQTGGILPINVQSDKIDFLCAAAHKGLYAPMGVGILIKNCDGVFPTVIEGGTGSMSIDLRQPDFSPDRYESGTGNTAGIIAVKSGIDEVNKIGIERIYKNEYELIKMLENGIKEVKGVKLYTSFSDNQKLVPLLSFNIDGLHSEETAEKLNEMGIAVRAGLHCAPCAHKTFGTTQTGTVRICPSIFTKKEDIYFTIKCIRKIANSINM